LPKYAPELNDIEVVWHDLKAHHLAHQTFTAVAALDQWLIPLSHVPTICSAVATIALRFLHHI